MSFLNLHLSPSACAHICCLSLTLPSWEGGHRATSRGALGPQYRKALNSSGISQTANPWETQGYSPSLTFKTHFAKIQRLQKTHREEASLQNDFSLGAKSLVSSTLQRVPSRILSRIQLAEKQDKDSTQGGLEEPQH